MRPIPFPILLPDRQAYVVRAHRMRGAVRGGPDPRFRPLGFRRRPLNRDG